jgi:TRAP-type C4-dicarboxylate transport system substrate-binding protein
MSTIVKTMEALGANVVSIPFIETYMGLKTGAAVANRTISTSGRKPPEALL